MAVDHAVLAPIAEPAIGERTFGAPFAAGLYSAGTLPSVAPHRAPRFYRPELDLLRFAAFLMVWFSHALIPFQGLLPARWLAIVEGAGSCGVPIFFFLSAYLITELLRRERIATGGIHLGDFYMRRILRIWPLYLGALGAYGLLGLWFHGFRIEPGRLLASCLLAGNWYIALHPSITTPMRSLWSISVEEQWYLLCPAIWRRIPRLTLLWLCAGVVAGSAALLAWLTHHSAPSEFHVTAWVNSGVQFQYLAMGAATALLLDGRIPGIGEGKRTLLAGAGALAILAAAGACRIKQAGVPHAAFPTVCGYLLAGIGAACLFIALLGMAPARCPRLLVRLGKLSYGLYVLHEPGLFLADEAVRKLHLPRTIPVLAADKLFALLLTIALAIASYHLWELPFLRLKQRWTHIRSRVPA